MFEIRPILSALSRHKSSTLLIVIQIAITFAVVINAISIIQQRIALMNRDSGLPEGQLITLNVNAIGEDYKLEQNIRADIELLRATPGVIDAVAINQVPLTGNGDSRVIATSEENFKNQVVFPSGFFAGDSHTLNTLGVELSAGKNYSEEQVQYTMQSEKTSSIIITQSLADKLFPDQPALGKQVYLGDFHATVIAVIKKMSGPWVHFDFNEENVIVPVVQLSNFKRILIRTEANAVSELAGNVEKLLLDRNPNRVITSVRTLKEAKSRSYSSDNAMTKILWVVIALLISITALGIVGIVSFNVNQRTRQIGTRRALGATRAAIQRYFLTENLLITSFGLFLGTLVAISFNHYLVQSFAITPFNWLYLPAGMLIMLCIGLLSVWIPAQKAASVSPAVATQNV